MPHTCRARPVCQPGYLHALALTDSLPLGAEGRGLGWQPQPANPASHPPGIYPQLGNTLGPTSYRKKSDLSNWLQGRGGAKAAWKKGECPNPPLITFILSPYHHKTTELPSKKASWIARSIFLGPSIFIYVVDICPPICPPFVGCGSSASLWWTGVVSWVHQGRGQKVGEYGRVHKSWMDASAR